MQNSCLPPFFLSTAARTGPAARPGSRGPQLHFAGFLFAALFTALLAAPFLGFFAALALAGASPAGALVGAAFAGAAFGTLAARRGLASAGAPRARSATTSATGPSTNCINPIGAG